MFLLKADNRLISTLLKLLILVLMISPFSCKEKKQPREIERSFYYWKSVLSLSAFEKQKLEALQVKTIYIKFFDVDWDEAMKAPVPVAKLQAANYKLPDSLQIIPTIFITNACIQKIDTSDIGSLAIKIYQLIKEIRNANDWKYARHIDGISEIQIDCDWTALTKNKYFKLLNILREHICYDGLGYTCRISCTIRLHQIKYMAKTGIPPVDRGLLMCYNMGNLKDPDTKNSILETAELKKYIGNLSSYPLPLDIAFPLFDWKVLYRNNFYTGLIQNLPDAVFTGSFSKQTGNRYEILKDTLLGGYDLRKGDMIRDEQSDIKEVLAAANELSKRLKNTPLRVSLYHLDSVILSKYSTHELETLYNSLR